MPRERKRRTGPPAISKRTLERRTVLEWLGKGTVFALGSAVLARCGLEEGAMADADDAIGGDADGGFDASDRYDAAGGFPFQPGDGSGDVYRSWNVRTIDPQDVASILRTWRLRVDGMVDTPFELTFAELVDLPRQDQLTDFHCVEGWSVHDVPWNGVHLSTLFDRAGVQPSATHVTFHTVRDEYNESLPIEIAREPRTILGYGVAGSTLPLDHGFPARVVVPRLLGYKNAKYVYRIELTDHPINGYWVSVGYPYDGEVPAGRLREGRY